MDNFKSFAMDFMVGGLSATIGKSIVAPAERIKLILQVQDMTIQNQRVKEKPYKGMADAFVRISKKQGFMSLWRGNMANIYKYFPQQALSFSFKDFFNLLFDNSKNKEDNFRHFMLINILSGGLAGIASSFVVYPLDFARTRLATNTQVLKKEEYSSIWDCLKKTAAKAGVLSWYSGFNVSAQGFFIYRAMYFGLYDSLKESEVQDNASFIYNFCLAQIVTILAGYLSYPFDSVRRRLMMQSDLKPEDRIYKSTIDCWVMTYRKGGIGLFYKGSVANVIRSTGSALALTLYDVLKDLLKE